MKKNTNHIGSLKQSFPISHWLTLVLKDMGRWSEISETSWGLRTVRTDPELHLASSASTDSSPSCHNMSRRQVCPVTCLRLLTQWALDMPHRGGPPP